MSSAMVLFVSGYTGSGPDHFPSHWQRQHPEYQRVVQRNWDRPSRDEWVAALDAHVAEAVLVFNMPIVLIGHSLGCITIAYWAAATGHADRIKAAMLVAPSDVEAGTAPVPCRTFAPVPLQRLPFSSTVVASANDEFTTLDRAHAFAAAWGSQFVNIGNAGHIATKDGYGPWPEGLALLESLVA
jgi:uncharacterized protein